MTLLVVLSWVIACTKQRVKHLSFFWATLQLGHLTMAPVKESSGIFLLQLRQLWYWPKVLIPTISATAVHFVKGSGSSRG